MQTYLSFMRNLDRSGPLVIIFLSFVLNGCAGGGMQERSQEKVAQTRVAQKSASRIAESSRAPAVVERVQRRYADLTPHPLNTPPSAPEWLNKTVELEAQALPFAFLASTLLRDTGISSSFTPDTEPQKQVSLSLKGPLGQALDTLARHLDYNWKIEGSILTWSAFEERTFDIAFLPGSVEINQSSTDGASTTDGNTTQGQAAASPEQIKNKAQLSLWDDLEKSLELMLSEKGQVFISESNTSVLVRDTPGRIKQIAGYLEQLNRRLSQQVMLEITVLDVALHDQFSRGVDWNLVLQALPSLDIGFSSTLSERIVGLYSDGLSTGQFSLSRGNDSVLFKALQEQGELSVVSNPRIISLNNQVAEIQVVEQTSYLAEMKTTQTADVGSTVELTPGRVADGLRLFLLPKIMQEKVYLQITANLSQLESITRVSVGDSGAIETPQLAEKRFNQRTLLYSGETLVLTGFRQITNSWDSDRMVFHRLEGAKGARQQRVETVVLITPTILSATLD